MKKRRILYIQHAGALGGSCASLLYTMQGVRKLGFEPVVALARPSREVLDFYRSHGFEVLEWPGIQVWDVTNSLQGPAGRAANLVQSARVFARWTETERRTLALVDAVRPDLVHLNSVVLGPSAAALAKAGVRFVWHVREQPMQGLTLGQLALARSLLMRAGDELVFISNADRHAWVKGRRGVVVHNFVDFDRFDPARVDPSAVRDEFGIAADAPVLLYVGGINPAKGGLEFVQAMGLVKRRFPGVRALMPGSLHPEPTGRVTRAARYLLPKLGWGTYAQRAEGAIDRLSLRDALIRTGFRADIERFVAASDVVVFPATVPHFARPAVEAEALGKPVVASNLPGLDEIIAAGETGTLVPAGDPRALAEAVCELLANPARAREMGRAGVSRAKRLFAADANVRQITRTYEQILGTGSFAPARTADGTPSEH